MNKSRLSQPDRLHFTGFLVCAALFILGCVAGAIASGALPADTPMNEFIVSLARAENLSFGERFLSALRATGKFHALVLFFAFSALGIAAIPAVSALRGFLLCFAITSVVRGFGGAFVPYALLMFVPEALFAVPGLFLLSTHSLVLSTNLLRACLPRSGSPSAPFCGVFIRRILLCAALVCATALVNATVAPWLVAHFPR